MCPSPAISLQCSVNGRKCVPTYGIAVKSTTWDPHTTALEKESVCTELPGAFSWANVEDSYRLNKWILYWSQQL